MLFRQIMSQIADMLREKGLAPTTVTQKNNQPAAANSTAQAPTPISTTQLVAPVPSRGPVNSNAMGSRNPPTRPPSAQAAAPNEPTSSNNKPADLLSQQPPNGGLQTSSSNPSLNTSNNNSSNSNPGQASASAKAATANSAAGAGNPTSSEEKDKESKGYGKMSFYLSEMKKELDSEKNYKRDKAIELSRLRERNTSLEELLTIEQNKTASLEDKYEKLKLSYKNLEGQMESQHHQLLLAMKKIEELAALINQQQQQHNGTVLSAAAAAAVAPLQVPATPAPQPSESLSLSVSAMATPGQSQPATQQFPSPVPPSSAVTQQSPHIPHHLPHHHTQQQQQHMPQASQSQPQLQSHSQPGQHLPPPAILPTYSLTPNSSFTLGTSTSSSNLSPHPPAPISTNQAPGHTQAAHHAHFFHEASPPPAASFSAEHHPPHQQQSLGQHMTGPLPHLSQPSTDPLENNSKRTAVNNNPNNNGNGNGVLPSRSTSKADVFDAPLLPATSKNIAQTQQPMSHSSSHLFPLPPPPSVPQTQQPQQQQLSLSLPHQLPPQHLQPINSQQTASHSLPPPTTTQASSSASSSNFHHHNHHSSGYHPAQSGPQNSSALPPVSRPVSGGLEGNILNENVNLLSHIIIGKNMSDPNISGGRYSTGSPSMNNSAQNPLLSAGASGPNTNLPPSSK